MKSLGSFDFQTRKRFSLLETSLVDISFQLLPGSVYSSKKLEKGPIWQEKFLKDFENDFKFSIVIWIDGTVFQNQFLSFAYESLAVQSYKNFEVFTITSDLECSTSTIDYYKRFSLNGEVYYSSKGIVDLSLPGPYFLFFTFAFKFFRTF